MRVKAIVVVFFMYIGWALYYHLHDIFFDNINIVLGNGKNESTQWTLLPPVNQYIREDNLLPYSICGANALTAPSSQLARTFEFLYDTWVITITAASAWGEGDFIEYIEVLSYYSRTGRLCPISDGLHCVIPETMDFPFRCQIHQNHTVDGIHEAPTRDTRSFARTAEVLRCPVQWKGPFPDHFDLVLWLEENNFITIPMCLEQVDRRHNVTVCTQPHFGWANNDFWLGKPTYNHNLLVTWLTFHAHVLGYHVRFNDLHKDFETHIAAFNSSLVSYRHSWDMTWYPVSGRNYDFECLAEATCMWNARLTSHWVIILHSVDNFFMPAPGFTLASSLTKLNVSSVIIPMVQGYTSQTYNQMQYNVLQRYSLRGMPFPFGDARHTPAANPRHIQFGHVHWNVGRKLELFRGEIGYEDAWNVAHLSTLHIMALARPGMNDPAQGTFDTEIWKWGRDLDLEFVNSINP